MDENCYGMHLTLRIANVEKSEALNLPEIVHKFLVKLVTDIGMRILAGPLVAAEHSDEGKSGCSGLIILYESHAAIHTYVDMREAFLDVFSCKQFNTEQVSETIREFFGEHSITESNLLDRGHHWQTDLQASLSKWHCSR